MLAIAPPWRYRKIRARQIVATNLARPNTHHDEDGKVL
jgi:hypothetical protein